MGSRCGLDGLIYLSRGGNGGLSGLLSGEGNNGCSGRWVCVRSGG